MSLTDKPLVWLHGLVKTPPFSVAARLEAGYLLRCMTMRTAKRKKLASAGWKVGGADEFLGLTADEAAYIEMKLALGISLRDRRIGKNLSQVEFARMVKSSQSRVAKMEAGDPSVSIDLLMKSLLALGASPKELAKAISSSATHAA